MIAPPPGEPPRPAVPPLLRTFGHLRLETPATASGAAFRNEKALLLLAFLVVEGRRPVERSRLADFLWGDDQAETARQSLRQAVFVLRRELGGEVVIADRRTVSLAEGGLDSDLARAEAGFARGDLAEVLRWYEGPFCQSLDDRHGETVTRWVGALRLRWRERLLALATVAIEQRVARGETAEAAALARGLARVEPTLDGVPELVADALVSAGAAAEALEVLQRAREACVAADAPVPASVATRISRLARSHAAVPAAAMPERPRLDFDQRLVGREETLAHLFRLVEEARQGRMAQVTLVGPPGVGKSRVLDELEARVRPRGVRVARVRYLPEMRGIAWAGLGEMARALSALPGAMGIGEASANTLVGLAPELQARFPAAEPSRAEDARLRQVRAEAIADLLEAVSEDRPLVLLQDDAQYLDVETRLALDRAMRRQGLRLLDVRASRTADVALESGHAILALEPLSRSEVEHLLEAALPEGQGVAVAEAFMQATGGIPQLLMLELRQFAQGSVLPTGGSDATEAGTGDAARGPRLGALPRLRARVESLSAAERLVLRVVALWRRPLDDPDLMAVLRALDDRREASEWRRALSTLESEGYVLLRRDAWEVAHDLVTDAILRGSEPDELRRALHALVRSVAPAGGMSVPELEHLALLCGQHDALDAALALARRARHERGLRALGVRGRAIAQRIARSAGQPSWERPLVRALGPIGRRSPGEQVALGALVTMAVLAFGWLLSMLQPRLVVESVPMAAPGESSSEVRRVGFWVQPRVGVYDGFGRRLRDFDGRVVVSVDEGRVVRDAERQFQDGRAQFESVFIEGIPEAEDGRPPWELRFDSSWWVRGTSVRPMGQGYGRPDRFRLVRVSVNGDSVAADGRYLHDGSRDSLTVVVTYEYTTSEPVANYVVAAGVTWLPPGALTVRIAGLPRPVEDAWQTMTFSLPAPRTPGRHAIVIAMAPEGGAEEIMSQTNWTVGGPVWGDGNDLVTLSPEELEVLQRNGRVRSRGKLRGVYRLRQGSVEPGRVPVGEPERLATRLGSVMATELIPAEVVGGVIWVQTATP